MNLIHEAGERIGGPDSVVQEGKEMDFSGDSVLRAEVAVEGGPIETEKRSDE